VLDRARCGVVLRPTGRDGISPEEVAGHLGLPLVGVLPDDARVRRDEQRARMPGTRVRGVVAATADRVLEDLAGRAGVAYGVGA
jgi:hypothetical protein